MFTAKLKSESLAYPSSVSAFLADSFPPLGKFKGTLPKRFMKDCCFENLPLWGKVAERLQGSRKVVRPCGKRTMPCIFPQGMSAVVPLTADSAQRADVCALAQTQLSAACEDERMRG